MSIALSIQMDEDLKLMLDKFAKKFSIQENEIIDKALRHYLYMQEVNTLGEELKPYAQAQGFKTEEDLLNAIS